MTPNPSRGAAPPSRNFVCLTNKWVHRTSDLFSFQGVLPTSTAKAPKLPDSIADWPALPPDLVAASIKPFPRSGDPQRRPGGPPEEVLDDVRAENSLNYDSLVIAADDQNRCHFFMDATYPLGSVTIGEVVEGVTCQVASLINLSSRSTVLTHVTYQIHEQGNTNLVPVAVDLTALRSIHAREVAKASSAARELAWYMLRVLEEMRTTWIGSSEHGEGARNLGPKWVKELEAKQRAHGDGNSLFWSDILPLNLSLGISEGSQSSGGPDSTVGHRSSY
jgi:anaphase-promoting complex subunit 4